MIKCLFSIFIFLTSSAVSAQTPQIALVRPSTGVTQFFTTLTDAYNAAINEDEIYLPNGVFNFPYDTLNKKLHFYGFGFGLDSTEVTNSTTITTNSALHIGNNASNSVFEGIAVMPNGHFFCYNNALTFLSCKTQNVLYNLSNALVFNSVINGYPYHSKNSTFSNCVIQAFWNDTNLIVKNCIIMQEVAECKSVTVKNCIFSNNIQNPNFTNQNTYFYNCLSLTNNLGTFSNQINCIGYTGLPNDVFEENSSSYWFTDYYNYELKPTCIAKNAGTDGTDLGIYGGNSPCPKGWKPRNPHYQKAEVNTQTNLDGSLKVKFTVEAQK